VYKAVDKRLLEKKSNTLPITTRLEVLTAKAIKYYKKLIDSKIVYKKTIKIRAKEQASTTARYRLL
jgi:hypothetical protein